VEAKTAWDKGASEEQMKDALNLIRQAQWRWDFSAAGHGNSFHAPIEISRIIASGIAKAQDARLELSRTLASLGYNQEIPYPDIATKAKAQQYIGLDMASLRKEKAIFIDNVIPGWIEQANNRQKEWK
jgi:nitrite reductase (cytochrome c-552)